LRFLLFQRRTISKSVTWFRHQNMTTNDVKRNLTE
jgi:hypothetical protein